MRLKSTLSSWIVMPGLLILFLSGMKWVADHVDQWRFPWGYANSGRPTLAGTWVGPLISGSGQRLGMLVEMELAPLDRGRRRSTWFRTRRSHWLEGRVLVCARPGRVQYFRAWGKPEDTKTASRFRLAISQADSVPLDGLSPSGLRGQWGGKDSITLAVSLYMQQGKSAITSTADPDTKGKTPATLVRGTKADFDSLCNRLPT